MASPTVLIADDEPETRKYLRVNLVARGYRVLEAETGEEALDQLWTRGADLVLLDVRMPRLDGYQVCSQIRRTSDVPIIFLTGKVSERDLVKAFDLGGDDYLTKPFGVSELMARVRATLRRVSSDGSNPNHPEVMGSLVVDTAGRRVWKHGNEVDLTQTEFSLLSLLIKNMGKALTHRFILDKIWGESFGSEKQYVRAYMYRLRSKLEDRPDEPEYLQSVPGVGYLFTVPDSDEWQSTEGSSPTAGVPAG